MKQWRPHRFWTTERTTTRSTLRAACVGVGDEGVGRLAAPSRPLGDVGVQHAGLRRASPIARPTQRTERLSQGPGPASTKNLRGSCAQLRTSLCATAKLRTRSKWILGGICGRLFGPCGTLGDASHKFGEAGSLFAKTGARLGDWGQREKKRQGTGKGRATEGTRIVRAIVRCESCSDPMRPRFAHLDLGHAPLLCH